MSIKAYTELIKNAKGLEYRRGYEALKAYISSIDDVKFQNDLYEVEDVETLKYLFAVGLSAYRQKLVAERWAVLLQR